MGWLQGVLFNLVLAASYLLFWPLTGNSHSDITVLFTTYFATFIMADVTTTNIFGHDLAHTLAALRHRRSLISLLLMKNAVQLIFIIVPFTLITAGLTLYHKGSTELVLTIPAILYPMLLWLGIGNVISLIYPALPAPLQWRVTHLRDGQWRMHLPMLISYAIPYVLYFVTAYLDLPGTLNQVFSAFFGLPRKEEAGAILLGTAMVLYVCLTAYALWRGANRGVALPMQATLVAQAPLDAATKEAAQVFLTHPKWSPSDWKPFLTIGVAVAVLAGVGLDALIR